MDNADARLDWGHASQLTATKCLRKESPRGNATGNQRKSDN